MRIRKERLESNIRTSQLESELARVVAEAPEGIYVEEIILALSNLQAYWVNVLRNEEIPSVEKDEDEGSTT